MSTDRYMCVCCLSTNDLYSLHDSNDNNNYIDILESLFEINISDEIKDDGYICELCKVRLLDAQTLKSQVLDALNILQNRLISNPCKDDYISIDKLSTLDTIQNYYINSYTVENESITKLEQTVPQITITKAEDTTKQNGVNTIDEKECLLERDRLTPIVNNGKGQHDVPEQLCNVTRDLTCGLCGFISNNKFIYNAHMNNHNAKFFCDVCGKGFLTERRLKRHLLSHKKGPFKCLDCNAEFVNYNTLNSHRQRKHSTAPLYRCAQCGITFGTAGRRARHLAAAHGAPAARCSVCGLMCLNRGSLNAHVRRTHTKTLRHRCWCGAGFHSGRGLRDHAVTHAAGEVYTCTVCDKSYPRHKALVVHMRTHTDDRRFCCDICGKKFIQKCTLKVHLKVHNREIE